MKTFLNIIIIITIVGILKNKLQAKQQKSNNNETASTDEQSINNNEVSAQNNTTEINTQTKSKDVVNRDNVFDYLFEGMHQDPDNIWDTSKIKFQDPVQNVETGKWEILANNKSGAGSYVFKVTPNGEVQFYDTIGKNMERSIDVSL